MLSLTRPGDRTSRLSLLFLLFSFLFASSGIVLIVVSQIWRMKGLDKMGKHALRTWVVGAMDLSGASAVLIFPRCRLRRKLMKRF